MARARCRILKVTWAVLVVGCLGADRASAASVSAGRQVALDVCAACHLVAPDQEFPPFKDPPATPFATIAQQPGFSAAWLRNYIAATHPMSPSPHEMPNPQLTPDQVTDVAGYIRSLKPGK